MKKEGEQPIAVDTHIKNVNQFCSDDEDEDLLLSEEEQKKLQELEDKEYELRPVTKPTDIRGLLKIKTTKSLLDLTIYNDLSVTVSPSEDGSTVKQVKQPARTLDQILSNIHNDIIHEEKNENDSIGGKGGDSSDEGEDDYLSAED